MAWLLGTAAGDPRERAAAVPEPLLLLVAH